MQEQWGAELEVVIRVLQVALAPAFLLAAIASLLNVVTGRLARVVDRARALQAKLETAGDAAALGIREELALLVRRKQLVRRSMQFAVLAGIVICLMVAMLFIMGLASFSASSLVISMFAGAMGLIAASLGALLFETGLAASEIGLEPGDVDAGGPLDPG